MSNMMKRKKEHHPYPVLTRIASKILSPTYASSYFYPMQLKYINPNPEPEQAHEEMMIKLYHTHGDLLQNQCSSTIVQKIAAPLPLVWSFVRRFDNPQAYKQFVKNCTLSVGDGGAPGSVRELVLVSGLPAERSTERLDRLDDDLHVMVVTIIGGDHRLINYKSTVTLHQDDEGNDDTTVLIESYVVDIPEDSCREDTCLFADTIIGCNMRSLVKITEKATCQLPA